MLEYIWLMRSYKTNLDADSPGQGAARSAAEALRLAEEPNNRLASLELAIETLIRMGVEKQIYSEEEFFALARKIDAEDGIMDGQRDLSHMRKVCPECGKANSGNRMQCIWCGGSLEGAQPVSPNSPE